MINAKTQKEIDRLSDDLVSSFAPPEYIPGCKVTAITDKDEYAMDNGWIVAICGRHNNQRCRWTGQLSSVAVNDYVDVLYYPSYKLFVVFGQGGTSAAQSGNYLLTNGTRTGATGAAQDFGANGIKTDVIAESTSAVGVTVDGVKLKDSDVYPYGDGIGLHSRLVSWNVAQTGNYEKWTDATDDLVWTGWAAYTGFATPAFLTTAENLYSVAHNAVAKAFRYRAAATSDYIFLRTRCSITHVITGGIMIDDGVDAGDGNGANNFYRVYIVQSVLAGPIYLVEQYRTGGGAVTTNTSTGSASLATFIGLGISTIGTRWSNWRARPKYFGESGDLAQFTGGTAEMSWTPARVGLYQAFAIASGLSKALYSWYKESNA